MNARTARRDPALWVYLALLALTGLTWMLGQIGHSGLTVSLFVLASALLKGELVGGVFMGLGGLRGPWRWAITVWLVTVGVLVASAFLLTPEV
ncbi:MAG: cytochrome C oxidase subunit IV family protein [Gammaproteobacteria bacterium]